jgi:hypothetical protein
MRNGLAEWIVSQVAPLEKARVIVGDLLEEQRAPLMFWIAVLRATASIVLHQPRRTLWSAFWFFYDAALYYVCCFWLTHGRLSHRLPVAGLVMVLWMAIRLGIYRRFHVKGSSILAAPVFFVWFWRHAYGWPVALSSMAMAPAAVFGWWLQWRSRQSSAKSGGDRPIVG